MACEKGLRPQRTLHLFQGMQLQRLLTTVTHYNARISACKKGQQPSAKQSGGLPPKVITYNASVSACEKGQRPQRAPHQVRAWQSRRLLPKVITHNAAISACKKGLQPQQAMQV